MKSPSEFIGRLSRTQKIIGISVVGVAVLAFSWHAFHPASASTARARPTSEQVTLASVSSLSPANAPLSVIGSVTSQDSANILSETSGEIVKVNVQIGDRVSAGDVIATFENSSQEAAVLQAKGSYDAANAALAKATGATAENSTVNSAQADQDAADTQAAVAASLQSTYTSLDDAVHTKTDSLFTNPRTAPALIPAIALSLPDSALINTLESERASLEQTLEDASTAATAAVDTSGENSTQVSANISTIVTDAATVETYLNNLAKAVNETVPNSNISTTSIAAYQASITSARTEVVSAVSSLTSAKTTYDAAQASASTAQNTASGGTPNDIASAQAQVQEAQGAYDAAEAALEKTIVRSPITGNIVSLTVTTGDYVGTFSQIAEVSNPGALKITTYVTADDAKTLAVGNAATINGTINGVITLISPAIDPQTGTIEVDIGLASNQGLTDGDSVTVSLDRSTAAAAAVPTTAPASSVIPIVALKITPTGPAVFTVDPKTNTLVSHSVQIGSILGDNIVVTEGVTPDMMIVTDARGLTSGQIVSVKKGS